MKLGISGIAVAVTLAACHPAPTPLPPGNTDADEVVYGELVEAGCLEAEDGGVDYVAIAARDPSAPIWLTCLYDGGTVISCNVPCER